LTLERNSIENISLPGSSRVWLFGAHRTLTDAEAVAIQGQMVDFVSGWQAHGKDLTADFCLLQRCVLVVAVDESKEAPSGCSIDKVFHLLQSQKEKFDLDFFQRTLLWIFKGDDICILNKSEIQAGLDCGEIDGNTPTINMLASNLGDLKKSGLALPLASSWVASKLKFTYER